MENAKRPEFVSTLYKARITNEPGFSSKKA